MIQNTDFLPVDKDGFYKKEKCFYCKSVNRESDVQFYLTEWELTTGGSSQFGIIYCETCIKKEGYQ